MGVNAFPKRIKAKEKAEVWLEFELTNYDIAVQHVNHYATETLPYV